MNPQAKIMLLKTTGTAIKVGAILWIFVVALNYLIIPLAEAGVQFPGVSIDVPLVCANGFGAALLYWFGSKILSVSASTKADMEARFIGYMELYDDIGMDTLADKLGMKVADVENLIAQMKARGAIKDIAVSKETSMILYGKKAREYLEATAKLAAHAGAVKDREKARTAKEDPSTQELKSPAPATPTPVMSQRPSGPSSAEIDEKLYSYAISHKVGFSYSQASRELGIPITDLKESMDRLRKTGRVISYRKESPSLVETQTGRLEQID